MEEENRPAEEQKPGTAIFEQDWGMHLLSKPKEVNDRRLYVIKFKVIYVQPFLSQIRN